MNLIAIANACAVECERQQVGIYELGQLINAYSYMTKIKVDAPDVFVDLARIIEPVKNRHGYRITPVTFAGGGPSANARDIPRLMQTLTDAINFGPWNEHVADRLTKEFLYIHPFRDGNGRVAFLLYNYLMGTLDNPAALPKFF